MKATLSCRQDSAEVPAGSALPSWPEATAGTGSGKHRTYGRYVNRAGAVDPAAPGAAGGSGCCRAGFVSGGACQARHRRHGRTATATARSSGSAATPTTSASPWKRQKTATTGSLPSTAARTWRSPTPAPPCGSGTGAAEPIGNGGPTTRSSASTPTTDHPAPARRPCRGIGRPAAACPRAGRASPACPRRRPRVNGRLGQPGPTWVAGTPTTCLGRILAKYVTRVR